MSKMNRSFSIIFTFSHPHLLSMTRREQSDNPNVCTTCSSKQSHFLQLSITNGYSNIFQFSEHQICKPNQYKIYTENKIRIQNCGMHTTRTVLYMTYIHGTFMQSCIPKRYAMHVHNKINYIYYIYYIHTSNMYAYCRFLIE